MCSPNVQRDVGWRLNVSESIVGRVVPSDACDHVNRLEQRRMLGRFFPWAGLATPAGQSPSRMRLQKHRPRKLTADHASHQSERLLIDGLTLDTLSVA